MKTKWFFPFWILSILCMTLLFSAAVFADNGDHVNVDRSATSNLLIIGDSMVVVLSEDVPKASYNATSGGHFVYSREWVTGEWLIRNRYIQSRKYLAQQKTIIRNILRRQGSCVVVLLGSYNDVDYDGGWEASTRSSMLDLKKELEAVSVHGLTPRVFITSILPDKGEDEYVEDFNRKLQVELGSAFIDLGSSSAYRNYYMEDNSHLETPGSELMYRKILRAVNPYLKARIR